MAKPATPETVRRSYQAQLKIVARLRHSVNKARKTLTDKEVPLKVAETRLEHIANTPVFDEQGNLVQVDRTFLETPPTAAEAAAEGADGEPTEGTEGQDGSDGTDSDTEDGEDADGAQGASEELTFA